MILQIIIAAVQSSTYALPVPLTKVESVEHFSEGIFDEWGNAAKGVVKMALHPVDTLQNLGHAVFNPVETATNGLSQFKKSWAVDPAKTAGHVFGSLALLATPGAKFVGKKEVTALAAEEAITIEKLNLEYIMKESERMSDVGYSALTREVQHITGVSTIDAYKNAGRAGKKAIIEQVVATLDLPNAASYARKKNLIAIAKQERTPGAAAVVSADGIVADGEKLADASAVELVSAKEQVVSGAALKEDLVLELPKNSPSSAKAENLDVKLDASADLKASPIGALKSDSSKAVSFKSDYSKADSLKSDSSKADSLKSDTPNADSLDSPKADSLDSSKADSLDSPKADSPGSPKADSPGSPKADLPDSPESGTPKAGSLVLDAEAEAEALAKAEKAIIAAEKQKERILTMEAAAAGSLSTGFTRLYERLLPIYSGRFKYPAALDLIDAGFEAAQSYLPYLSISGLVLSHADMAVQQAIANIQGGLKVVEVNGSPDQQALAIQAQKEVAQLQVDLAQHGNSPVSAVAPIVAPIVSPAATAAPPVRIPVSVSQIDVNPIPAVGPFSAAKAVAGPAVVESPVQSEAAPISIAPVSIVPIKAVSATAAIAASQSTPLAPTTVPSNV